MTLTFPVDAHMDAFCTWFSHCFGGLRLTRDADRRTVRVRVPRRSARTVATVARLNGAIVRAA
jgi:hypothetical protein